MRKIWNELRQIREATRDRTIESLFDDPDRMERFSVTVDDLLLDFSKTNLDRAALGKLVALAEEAGVEARRDAMFAGERINETENRPVLHTALRTRDRTPILVDGEDVLPEIRRTRRRMERFCDGVRSGEIRSARGNRFTDVVNIGIGGSNLGPKMVTSALKPYHDGPRCHFVSNVDAAHIADTLSELDPADTLVILASKTFTTAETMLNGETAKAWLKSGVGPDLRANLAAASSAVERTTQFGIDPERVFGFADWVGGRHSLWGPVGLPIMMAVGPDRFAEFLDGANAMDLHFRQAPLARNMPALLALVGVWHNNVCGHRSRAILPYDNRLSRLPSYVQQLDMESNGKSVTLAGDPVETATGPIVWGEAGTDGQHSFHQLLHQGGTVVPVEFLIAARGHEPHLSHHHDMLKANCLAQSEALMRGRSPDEALAIVRESGVSEEDAARIAAHRAFPGNRPSVTLAYRKTTPFELGRIMALYEHRVFVEGAIWQINSFDQWGVELGKELAESLSEAVRGADASGRNPSTRSLLSFLSE